MASDPDRITSVAKVDASDPGYRSPEKRQDHMPPPARDPEDALSVNGAWMRWLYTSLRDPYARVRAWVSENAFTPEWMPPAWRRWWVGYGVALVMQTLATAFIYGLVLAFPSWRYPGSTLLLVTVVVALAFGAGPSLFAALLGTLLVYYVVMPPHFSLVPGGPSDVLGALLYACVGIVISILPSQMERARRDAEQSRAEATRRSEQLQATFDAMVDGVVVFDATGRVIQSNPAAQAFLARAVTDFDPDGQLAVRDRLTRMRLRTVTGAYLAEDDWPVMRLLRGETIHSEDAVVVQVATTKGDALLTLSGSPLRDADNQVTGAVMVLRDVTERERLEREAAQRATELATVVQAMPDAVALFDATGQAALVNAAFHELFALDQRPAFFGQSIEERRRLLEISDVDGNPLPPERSPLERVLRRGETLTGGAALVIRTEAPDGRLLDLEVVGRPVYDTGGGPEPGHERVRGAILLYRDVTERRRLERRTREALDALLRMAEALVVAPEASRQTPSTVRVADDAETPNAAPAYPAAAPGASTAISVVRRVAELARDVLGASRLSMYALDSETQIPMPLAVAGLSSAQERDWYSHSPGRPLRDTPVLNAILDEQPGIVRVLDLTRPPYDGLEVRFGFQTLALAPMQVGEQLVGVLAVDHGDVSHIYADDELDLIAGVARLAALIIERDRLLRERELAHGQALALAEANRRMDEFLSIASHEIKTPLTAIKANVQLVRRQASRALATAREQGYAYTRELELVANLASRAAAAADRQDRLVTDLLDVSRFTSGHLELRPARMDLAELLRDTVEEQRLTQPGRRLHVSGLVGPVVVEADAERIRQVIINYLSNALKYSPEDRSVDIQLTVDGRSARVTVRDEGTGIPHEELERIWNRFERARDAQHISGSSVGLGLGLYIAREIVERHHGTVGVESVVGQGSTVWFTLPLASDLDQVGSDA